MKLKRVSWASTTAGYGTNFGNLLVQMEHSRGRGAWIGSVGYGVYGEAIAYIILQDAMSDLRRFLDETQRDRLVRQ